MKFLAIVFILFGSMSLNAEEKEGKMTLEEKKSMVLTSIESRMSNLNEFKSCVSSAAEKKGIKDCRKSHKEKMKAFRDDRKEMREERKEMREERKEMRGKRREMRGKRKGKNK